jgi:tetratricopeptide (TPR) repeat protein
VNTDDITPLDITLKKDENTAITLQTQAFADILNKSISDENVRQEIMEKFNSEVQKEVKEINLLKSGRSFADLIRVSGEEERSILQQAQGSYEINAILPQEKQHYEPYFARARAWAEFGYYPEAMFDYLDGLQVIKRLKPISGQPENAFLLYEKYFKEMTKKVRIALNQPFNVTQMGRGTLHTAGRHFSLGYTAFWDGYYEEALKEFDNAIACEFYVPAYWYYRGLAYKRLCDTNKAIYCFLIASQMEKMTVEKRKEEPKWEQRYAVQVNSSRHLERFQGDERMWLEQIRWGDPSNNLLKEYYDEK